MLSTLQNYDLVWSQSEIVNPLSGAQKLARDLAALTQRSNLKNLERAINATDSWNRPFDEFQLIRVQ